MRCHVLALALLAIVALAGCSPGVAELRNPAYPRCRTSLRAAFEIILVGQGEKEDDAQKMPPTPCRR